MQITNRSFHVLYYISRVLIILIIIYRTSKKIIISCNYTYVYVCIRVTFAILKEILSRHNSFDFSTRELLVRFN